LINGRLGAGPLRGISALLLLGAVAAAGLLAVLHTLGVERAADDLVAHTREVLHTTAADEHHRVLLQVVALAGDVRRDLDLAGQANTRDLAQRGVRLLRGRGVHAGAHATTLRAPLEGRGLGLGDLVAATLADQLVDGWHRPAFLVDYAVSGRLFTNCMAGFRAVLARPTTFLASRGRACRARDGTRNPGTP